ncbi:MAG: hypothetical protein HUU35_14110 [Armatimonadetes bacterium]|nr:hypothetical protein [Armatimonadota bacterium]
MHHTALSALLAASSLLAAEPQAANTKDLGNGFRDHGVATPISNHRGTVATADAAGRDIVLSWLYDHRGGYALLLVDVETGKSEVFDMPYNWGGDGPFASILSSRNRFYTHYGSHFIEFDVAQRKFTFFQKTVPQMAMSMTEDDQGRIWSATYPNSGVACYDPASGAFRDYGHVYKQTWAQYQRSIAADDTGWIYFAIGNTSAQIIALDPESGTATPLLAEAERQQGTASLYRDLDGKVYALPNASKQEGWMELYRGQRRDLGEAKAAKPKPYIASSQGLFHTRFPSGRTLRALDLVNRVLIYNEAGSTEPKQVAFDYPSEGAHLMGLATACNGTICGGTAFPMRFFGYNPATDTWERHPGHGQFNTVAAAPDKFYFGGYGHGFLLEWDPAQPWVDTNKSNPKSNPRFLTECHPTINRPHDLLVHPDGRLVILAGTPGYGYTGGGLLLWDRQENKGTLLEHTAIIPEHATMALAALPNNKLLAGTTTSPGTGGQKKAEVAELYLMDLATQKVEWHEAVLPGVQNYLDLWVAPDGLVWGIADRTKLFAFDPVARKVVHLEDTTATLGASSSAQGSRVFIPAPDGRLFLLYVKGIAQLDPQTKELKLVQAAPLPIGPGGDWLDGRIYFGSGSHVYSWEVKP